MLNVSERKRLEAELRRSQQFLNSIIDNIPLAIFVKDVANDFRYTLINKHCERILGFSRAGAFGFNDDELLTPERAERHRNEDLEVVERRGILELPDQLFENSQEQVIVRGWKLPLFDDRGEVTHLLAIAEDITARKQGEQALRLIMEGTAATTGDEFFCSCVRYLVEVLGVRHAVVTEFGDAAKTGVAELRYEGLKFPSP